MKYLTRKFRTKRFVFLLAATVLLAALIGSTVLAAGAYANKVTYSGQGLTADGFGGYDLNREICGLANGADADGPYLLWVLTANKATNADITGPWGTAPMTKTSNGAFKFISDWYDPKTLPGTVYATYDGTAKNAQLVISHGCRPFTKGAWCSPGFWGHAEDAAWTLIGVSKTALFNDTVVPSFYDTASAANPTLDQVLSPPGGNTYGPPSSPFGLNAFNATGAYLTNKIPGYSFSQEAMELNNDSTTCPIDHHGDFKTPQ
jgi:hypothetical protein